MEAHRTIRTEVCQEINAASLRYRMRTLWLLAFYVPLVIIPWVLTCVLATRPINGSSYIKQQGFTATEVKNLRNWKTAVDVLNSITALITLPFLSTILAQAAVVFCQRQHTQLLSLRDVFALADRGWTNPYELWKSIRLSTSRKEKTKASGPFLLLAALLILISAIQQPLYQILVPMETYPVTACSDTRYRYNKNDTLCQDGRSISYTSIGLDIEPAQMAEIYQNTFLPRLASDLAAIGLDEEQSNLWSDTMPESSWSRVVAEPDGRFKTLRPWLPSFANAESPTFFVTSLRTNSTTGVLREHLMRFNSSVQCEEIDQSSFPSPCPGENPFVARLQKTKDTDIRVCVPGNVGIFPWRLSRNRQDITEELYLDLWDGDLSTREDASFKNVSATVRCEAKTTRGYFEMGNTLNGDTYGPLLDQWPSPERMQAEFNDYVKTEPYRGKGFTPSENDTWAGEEARYTSTLSISDSWKTSGPLTSSAMAMFGNTSWLHNMVRYGANTTFEDRNDRDKVEWDLLCAGMPYGRLFGTWSEGFPSPATSCKGIDNTIVSGQKPSRMKVLQIIHEWVEGFAPARRDGQLTNAVSLLETSLYVSNRALLTFYSPNSSGGGSRIYPPSGRAIYTAPGQAVQKPVVSMAAVVVLSLLIGLQLIGLAFLACYIYRVPTWTVALDARAMARIGACMRQGDVPPPIGAVTQWDRDVLKVDGLVGIDHGQVSTSLLTLAPDQRSDRKSSDFDSAGGSKNNL